MLDFTEIKTNLWQYVTVLSLAVILVFSLIFGVRNGKYKAQAEVSLANAQTLKQGMALFHQDQDRFPTNVEFANNLVMTEYFSSFPAKNFVNPTCQQSFVYKPLSFQKYELQFCLPASLGSFVKGWNKLTN